ncbi:MAG: signal peptide peptidase SppA [Sedimentisphaerales bacterium]|nr:signal peptide peptidase SppA [Sedimentisphaerales bacterium]
MNLSVYKILTYISIAALSICVRVQSRPVLSTMVPPEDETTLSSDESLKEFTQASQKETPLPTVPLQVAVIQVSGYISEKPGSNLLTFSGVDTTNLFDFTETLEHLSLDDQIQAVVFNIDQPVMSWAHVDQLRRAIAGLRKAGKKTYAYVETLSKTDYLFACQCDEIYMTPAGGLFLTGLSGRALYFKNLFDKIGIETDFIQRERYKSAAEPFTHTQPSPEAMEQLNRLFDDLYEHLINSIAKSRNIPTEDVVHCINQGILTPTEAKTYKLIDHVMYRNEFLDHLRKENDTEIQLYPDYGKTDHSSVVTDNPFAILAMLQELFSGPPEPPGDAIAIVYIDGPITTGESSEGISSTTIGARTVRMALTDVRGDDDIKAVIVRIDSPGGSATGSDIIYEAIRQTAEVKPVIISMGSVAGSGGYYVSCGGPTILAEECTITGSIGVIGGKLVIGGLLDKLGITTYVYKRGQNSGIFDIITPFTDPERQKFESYMDFIYELFKTRVTDSRAEKLQDSIDFLAQGKVYTGVEAKELGLIDDLGGLDDAIQLAAQKAGIEEYHIRHLPKPKSLIELLEELLARDEGAGENPAAGMDISVRQNQIPENALELIFKSLNDPQLLRAWQNAMGLLSLLKQEQVLMMMPYEIIIE